MRRLGMGVLVIVAAVVMAVGPFAQGGIITSNIVADGRIHGLQDTDADVGVTWNGSSYELAGTLAVGDFLVAGINFDSMERLLLADVNMTTHGANAFAMLKISSLSAAGTNAQGIALADFVFSAPTTTEWGDIVDDVFGGAAGLKKATAGGLVIIYEDADLDFDRIAPPATLAGSADTLHTGATVVGEIGFTGAVVGGNVTDNATGEGWAATAPTTAGDGDAIPLNTGILDTSFTLAVTRLSGWGGLNFIPLLSTFDGGGTADFVGGGTLVGYGDGDGNAVGPWQIGSDADISFRPVPEPASILVWAGIIGLAFGFVRTRRNR